MFPQSVNSVKLVVSSKKNKTKINLVKLFAFPQRTVTLQSCSGEIGTQTGIFTIIDIHLI